MNSIDRVKEFHTAFGHPVEAKPTIPSYAMRRLRVQLIAEELVGFARASGIGLIINSYADEVMLAIHDEPYNHSINMIDAADGLGDLDYVVNGAMLVWGFPAEAIYTEVHASNMSKLGEDGKPIYRQDGKVLKGPHFRLPNIGKVIGIGPDNRPWYEKLGS